MAMSAQWTIIYAMFAVYCSGIGCILFNTREKLPLLLTTWPYKGAVQQGWNALSTNSGSAVDAVEATGTYCELHQCRKSVGYGSRPDESGETTLDAMIMDGTTHNVGAVGALRRVKRAISVARKVLENTDHTLLVGDQATQFAVEMGFTEQSLTSNFSQHRWETWKQGHCQPNFRDNVSPDPRSSCGPYTPTTSVRARRTANHAAKPTVDSDNHDTIGIIAITQDGNVAAGTSTSGLRFKVPGRVGDSPIPGAGSYADGDIGAATCTGNGDIMMRFVPSFQAVSLMGTGLSPEQAAGQAIGSILRKYPDFSGAVVAANKQGQYGASCHKWDNFAITVRTPFLSAATVFNITCHDVDELIHNKQTSNTCSMCTSLLLFLVRWILSH